MYIDMDLESNYLLHLLIKQYLAWCWAASEQAGLSSVEPQPQPQVTPGESKSQYLSDFHTDYT